MRARVCAAALLALAAGCASESTKRASSRAEDAAPVAARLDPLASVLPALDDAVWLRFDGPTAEATAPALGATLALLLPDADARRRFLARPSDPLAALLDAWGVCAVASDFYLPPDRPTFVALRAAELDDAERALELALPPLPAEARPTLVVDVFLPADDADDLRRDVRLWVEQLRSNPTGDCDVRGPRTRLDTERDPGQRAAARAELARAGERRARSQALVSDVSWDDGWVRAQLAFPLAPAPGDDVALPGTDDAEARLAARLTPARLELLAAAPRVAAWARPRALARLFLAADVAHADDARDDGAPGTRWVREAVRLSALTRDRHTSGELEDLALVVTAAPAGAALALTATPTAAGRRAFARPPRAPALPLLDDDASLLLDVGLSLADLAARVAPAPWGAPWRAELDGEPPPLPPAPLLSPAGVLGLLHAPLATLGARWQHTREPITRLRGARLRGYGDGPGELALAARFPGDNGGAAAAGGLRSWLADDNDDDARADTRKEEADWFLLAGARERAPGGAAPPEGLRVAVPRAGALKRAAGASPWNALRRWLLHAPTDAPVRARLTTSAERLRVVVTVGDAPAPPPAGDSFAPPLAPAAAREGAACAEGLRQNAWLLAAARDEPLTASRALEWYGRLVATRACPGREGDAEQSRAEARAVAALAALTGGADEASARALLALGCERGDRALCDEAARFPAALVRLPHVVNADVAEPSFRPRDGFALRADAAGLRRARLGLFTHAPASAPLTREALAAALADHPRSLRPFAVGGALAGRDGALWSLYADATTPLATLGSLVDVHDGRPSWLTLAVRKGAPLAEERPPSAFPALDLLTRAGAAPLGALVFGLAASRDLSPVATVVVGGGAARGELRALGARLGGHPGDAPREVHVKAAKGATVADLAALAETVWAGVRATASPRAAPPAQAVRLVLVFGEDVDL